MNKMKRSLPVFGIVVLLAAVFIGGTFAFFSQTATAENYLTALKYDSSITEAFTPPADGAFAPGVKVDKAVGACNTGEIPMLVRIKYTETWTTDPITPLTLTYQAPVQGTAPDTYWYYDGATETDSIVQKIVSTVGLWTYGGDGYYYYLAEVGAQVGSTPTCTTNFIDSIMLKNSTMTTDTTYVVDYWNGTARVTSAPLTSAEKDALLLTITGNMYLNSVVSNETTTAPEGDYKLSFTIDTVQAIRDGAASWTTPITSEVTAFLNLVQ